MYIHFLHIHIVVKRTETANPPGTARRKSAQLKRNAQGASARRVDDGGMLSLW